jgi:hypothetical protein
MTPNERRFQYLTDPMFHQIIDTMLVEFVSRYDDELTHNVARDLLVLGDAFLVRVESETAQASPDDVLVDTDGLVVRPSKLPPNWDGPTEFHFAPGSYLHLTLDREKTGPVPGPVVDEAGLPSIDMEAVERWREEWDLARKKFDAFRQAA